MRWSDDGTRRTEGGVKVSLGTESIRRISTRAVHGEVITYPASSDDSNGCRSTRLGSMLAND